MSKNAKPFFEQLKEVCQPAIGAVEAIHEGVQAIAPGLSLSKMLAEVGAELKQQLAHGSHELAAGIFREHAGFVMYPRQEGVEQSPDHGMHGPEINQPEQERGGREV